MSGCTFLTLDNPRQKTVDPSFFLLYAGFAFHLLSPPQTDTQKRKGYRPSFDFSGSSRISVKTFA